MFKSNLFTLYHQGPLRREVEEGRRLQQRPDGSGLGERERAVLEGGPHDEGHPPGLLAELPGSHRAQPDEGRQDRRPEELRHRVGADGAEGDGGHGC